MIYYGIKVKFIKKSVTIFTIYSIREYGFKSDIITSKIYLRNNGEVWRNLLQSIPFIRLKMTNKSYFHKSIILLRNKLKGKMWRNLNIIIMVYTIYSVRKCDKKGYIYNLFYYGIKRLRSNIRESVTIHVYILFPLNNISQKWCFMDW